MSWEYSNMPILISLLSFNQFLDRAVDDPYIPGTLTMSINVNNSEVYWLISKIPHIDVLKPHRMFFGEVGGIFNKKTYVTDQETSIDDLIEGVYNIKLSSNVRKMLLEGWGNPHKLELIKKHNPEIYDVIKRRFDIVKRVSEKYGVNIGHKIDEEDGDIWMEIEVEYSLPKDKETLKEIFYSIEILREIYRNIFGCSDEEQKYAHDLKEPPINRLRIHVSTVYEIISLFKDKLQWKHIGFSESPGFTGSKITLFTKTKDHTQAKFFVSRELNKGTTRIYDIRVWLKLSPENITLVQNKLKNTHRKDNQIYYEKTDLTLVQASEEIKKILDIIKP